MLTAKEIRLNNDNKNLIQQSPRRSRKGVGGGGMNECKYCCVASKNLGICENADPRIFITVSGAYLQIFDEEYPGFIDSIKINYCPMCGRKLS